MSSSDYDAAVDYVLSLSVEDLMKYQMTFSSLAIENNLLAVRCGRTLKEVLSEKNVEEKNLLELVDLIKESEELKKK